MNASDYRMRIYSEQAFLATMIPALVPDITPFAFCVLLLSCCLNVLNVQRAYLDQTISRETKP